MKTTQLFCALLLSSLAAGACDSGEPHTSADHGAEAGSEPPVEEVGLKPEQLSGTYLVGISTVLARSKRRAILPARAAR